MYDTAVEAQVEPDSRNPAVRKRARQVRLVGLLLAAFSLPAAALMIYIGIRGGIFLGVFGVGQMLVALFYTSKAEARTSLKGYTDLYRMSTRR